MATILSLFLVTFSTLSFKSSTTIISTLFLVLLFPEYQSLSLELSNILVLSATHYVSCKHKAFVLSKSLYLLASLICLWKFQYSMFLFKFSSLGHSYPYSLPHNVWTLTHFSLKLDPWRDIAALAHYLPHPGAFREHPYFSAISCWIHFIRAAKFYFGCQAPT